MGAHTSGPRREQGQACQFCERGLPAGDVTRVPEAIASPGSPRLMPGRSDKIQLRAVDLDEVRCCSPGQITDALFEVGGQCRRNM